MHGIQNTGTRHFFKFTMLTPKITPQTGKTVIDGPMPKSRPFLSITLHHFKIPTGAVDATRKMALGVTLVLERSPWWLVLITEFLLLPGVKVPP